MRPEPSDALVAQTPAAAVPPPAEQQPPAKPKPKRGHAQKDENGKYVPTGDYPNGFARTPKEHWFDGSKPGPGRPKGSRSQDTIWREELSEQVTLTVDGVSTKISKRELAPKLLMKKALEKQESKDLLKVDDIAQRLFPDRSDEIKPASLGNPAHDQALIAQFLAAFTLGEPNPDAPDPCALSGLNPVAGMPQQAATGPWNEGDWGSPGDPEPDEDEDTADDGDDQDGEQDDD